MLIHPQFDPVAFAAGPVQVRWYGLMYLVGFAFFYFLGRMRSREAWRGMAEEDALEDLLFYGILGVVLGGRLGYCLFYQPLYFAEHPLEILRIWEGGMSAHGGMLGCLLAILYFCRTHKARFLQVADFVTPMVPAGLFFGRIGNFINGELWGRAVSPDFPLAMVFPQSGTLTPRHPSQLYEAGLEGALLFLVLWIYSKKPRPAGTVAGLFCLGYGVVRFLVEYVREPDWFLGVRAFGFTQGQWLSMPLILTGAVLFILAGRKKRV